MPEPPASMFLYLVHLDLTLQLSSDKTALNYVCTLWRKKNDLYQFSATIRHCLEQSGL